MRCAIDADNRRVKYAAGNEFFNDEKSRKAKQLFFMKLKLIASQEWQLSPLFREQLAKWQRQKAAVAKAPRPLPSAQTLQRRRRHKEARAAG